MVFFHSCMKLSRSTTDVGFETIEALHFVDTHFDIAQLGVFEVAISEIALAFGFVPVEEGTEITVFAVNSYR